MLLLFYRNGRFSISDFHAPTVSGQKRMRSTFLFQVYVNIKTKLLKYVYFICFFLCLETDVEGEETVSVMLNGEESELTFFKMNNTKVSDYTYKKVVVIKNQTSFQKTFPGIPRNSKFLNETCAKYLFLLIVRLTSS